MGSNSGDQESGPGGDTADTTTAPSEDDPAPKIDLGDISEKRREIGELFLAGGLIAVLVILFVVITKLPSLAPIRDVGDLERGELWYALGILSAHAIATGSVLYICLKIMDVGERLVIPITEGSKVPALTANSDGSGDDDEDKVVEKIRDALEDIKSALIDSQM